MKYITADLPDISFIDNCTVEEILTQMINDYKDKYRGIKGKEVSLARANPYRLIMHACAVQIYQGMQYADYAGKMSFLKYAHDSYLDNLAALRGVVRMEATAASTVLQFSVSTAIESSIAIPAGTRVTNGNDIYFCTDEYAEIAAGHTSVIVQATCTTTGLEGNGLAPGELNVLVNTLPYISSVTNIVTTYGGADTENDESLKDRIFSAPGAYTTTGSAAAYEYHTKSVDMSISDVVVTSSMAGTVDIYFVCDGGRLPEDSLIEKVKQYLMDSNVRPLTDNVTVQAPVTQKYNIEFTYYICARDKAVVSSIQADIDTAVSIYNTWQTEKIGRDINPSCLIQKVMAAGAKRIEVTSPSFVRLEETTIAELGEVNIIYGGLEDD